MDWSSVACGMAAMTPAQVLLILGFRHRGRRLARSARLLTSSSAQLRVATKRYRTLAAEVKACGAPRPARPVLSPASTSRPPAADAKPRDPYRVPARPVDDPAATVVIPEQRDATVVLPVQPTEDPAATVEIPVQPGPPRQRLAASSGMAVYPNGGRLRERGHPQ